MKHNKETLVKCESNCKISIIVPVYNVEMYLDRCVSSLVNQEFSNIEIILVNDGSTDQSGAICEKWAKKDKRVIVLNKKNGGLSSARNYGLRYASGELIGFVDSDDYVSADMYKRLDILIESYSADVACCSSVTFYKDKDISKTRNTVCEVYEMDKFNFYLDCISCKNGNGVGVCNKLFKREIFEKVKFKEGIYVEDYYSLPDIVINVEKAVMEPFWGYYYFQRADGITRGFYKEFEKHIHDRILGCRHNKEILISNGFSHDIIDMANAPRYLAVCRIAGICGSGKYEKSINSITIELRKNVFRILKSNLITLGVKKSYILWFVCPWAYYNAYSLVCKGRK